MKLLGWLFRFPTRHSRDFDRYEKRGKLSRILVFIFVPIFLVFGLGVIYFAGTLETNDISKFFAIVVAFLFSLACVEGCAVYCFCGFACFFWGSLESFSKRRQRKRELKKAQQAKDLQQSETKPAENLEGGAPTIVVDEGKFDESTQAVAGEEKKESITVEDGAKEKPVSKWLDLAVGIYCLVFAFGGAIGSFIMFVSSLSTL